jgi:hypothetical protein
VNINRAFELLETDKTTDSVQAIDIGNEEAADEEKSS